MSELDDARRAVRALFDELERHSTALSFAEEVSGRLAKVLRHDLRGRIVAITGLAGLLLERSGGELTDDQAKQVSFIQQAAGELLAMSDELLGATRLVEDGQSPRPARVSPDEVLSALRGLLTMRPPAEGFLTRFECPAGLPPLLTDSTLLLQALRQLAYNVAVFAGSNELLITAGAGSSPNSVVFRLEGSAAAGGTAGLEAMLGEMTGPPSLEHEATPDGRAVRMRQLRDQFLHLEWRLAVEAPEAGRWRVTLALPGDSTRVAGLAPSPVPAADPTQWPVLVVEDDLQTLAIYESYLRRSGYQMLAAHTVAEAYRILWAVRPVAIVLDLLLADETSWELLAELKSSEQWKQIPVFVASVLQDSSRGLAAGADGYGVKPVDRGWLLSRLAGATCGQSGGTVLIVDDQASDRLITRTMLVGTRFEVLEAADGTEGVRLARETRPVAILLDLAMPDMDGFEVLEALKTNPQTRTIPVIIVTATSCTIEQYQRLSAAGAVTILSKQLATRNATLSELGRALARVSPKAGK